MYIYRYEASVGFEYKFRQMLREKSSCDAVYMLKYFVSAREVYLAKTANRY